VRPAAKAAALSAYSGAPVRAVDRTRFQSAAPVPVDFPK